MEIVPAPWTSPETTQRVRSLMLRIGQAPIVLHRECIGFALNRLQYALLGEAMRMVEDGILSPEDVDTCVTHGLSPRWSFMGPFQTIDLNAPNGVRDYCERYLPGMSEVLREQDNNRTFLASTIERIDTAMRAKYSTTAIPMKTAWRDERLMLLARHKMECESIDSKWNDAINQQTSSLINAQNIEKK